MAEKKEIPKVRTQRDPVTGRIVRMGRFRRTVQRNILLAVEIDDIILNFMARNNQYEFVSYSKALSMLVKEWDAAQKRKVEEATYAAVMICNNLQGDIVDKEDGTQVCRFKRYDHTVETEVEKEMNELSVFDVKDQYIPNRKIVEDLLKKLKN